MPVPFPFLFPSLPRFPSLLQPSLTFPPLPQFSVPLAFKSRDRGSREALYKIPRVPSEKKRQPVAKVAGDQNTLGGPRSAKLEGTRYRGVAAPTVDAHRGVTVITAAVHRCSVRGPRRRHCAGFLGGLLAASFSRFPVNPSTGCDRAADTPEFRGDVDPPRQRRL